MEREIKFRGIPLCGIDFVYGSLVVSKNEKGKKEYTIYNFDNGLTKYQVKPETVGQLVGLLGEKAVEVYEGDLLKNSDVVYRVGYCRKNGMFMLYSKVPKGCKREGEENENPITLVYFLKLEVVSNIHQNPELIDNE